MSAAVSDVICKQQQRRRYMAARYGGGMHFDCVRGVKAYYYLFHAKKKNLLYESRNYMSRRHSVRIFVKAPYIS